jgi:hypothetical protein
VLTSISPAQLVVGQGATTLTLSGSGFVRSSQARLNDADRVTHYQDDHTLTMDLLSTDAASLATGKITVVNGAPGGGTSGVMTLIVGNPAPRITSITPTTSPIQPTFGTAYQVTITGTGFVSASSVRLGSNGISVISVTPTQIVGSINSFYLTTPGTYPLTVVNPAPGGGISNAMDFGVVYPAPTITSVAPDSALTGSAFTLTVNGTGFGSTTVIRWNGTDKTTTFVSSTRVTASISAADAASAGTASITVVNPAPGGGSSSAVSFKVRDAAPVISAISPGVISAGNGGVVLTITGTNFRSGATAQWNGQTRITTLVSSTAMTMTVLASDVATPQAGSVTVTNPGASGVSNAMAVAVLPAGASMSVARTITQTNADVAFDSQRNVIYASVPSTASQNANTIVKIDPNTGAITGTVSVGSNPATIAITDDNQFLYVALLGAPKVIRVALSTFTIDLEIPTRADSFFGTTYAEALVPLPGSPRTIVMSTYYTGVSPRNAGAFIFDDAVARSASGPGHTGSNRITRGPNALRIYGYNNETTEFGFRSVLVAADGLHEETVKAGLISGFSSDITYSGGYVYASTGEVIDVGAMARIGTIPASGVVRPDAGTARVHYLNGTTIRTYHYTTFASMGSFTDASLASHTRLIRWGTDGLAAAGGSTIVLLRGSLIGP